MPFSKERPRLPWHPSPPCDLTAIRDSFANDAENDAGVPLRLERVFSLSKSCYQITSFRIGVAL